MSTDILGLASAPLTPNEPRVGPTPRIITVRLLAPGEMVSPEVAVAFAARVRRVERLSKREELVVALTSYTSTIALPASAAAPATWKV